MILGTVSTHETYLPIKNNIQTHPNIYPNISKHTPQNLTKMAHINIPTAVADNLIDIEVEKCYGAGVPWDDSISKGHTLTACTFFFVFLIIVLFIFRSRIKSLPDSERKTKNVVFCFTMKTCIELPAFIMQVVLLSRLWNLDGCVSSQSLDIYLMSLIMTCVELISELYLRDNLSNILVLHHLLAVCLFGLLSSNNNSNLNTFSPIKSFPNHPNAWVSIMSLGTVMSMFQSSSVFTSACFILYNMKKDTHPRQVYQIMKVSGFLNFFAKIGLHVTFWVLYSRVRPWNPPSLNIVAAVGPAIFMLIEYYGVYTTYVIAKAHYKKRVKNVVLPTTAPLSSPLLH